MLISYNWLKDLIAIYLPADELAAQLTRVGITVEGVHPHGDDFVFDIDLTSNRPDCLSHLGVAREIAAITGGKLMKLETSDEPEAPLPAVLAYDVVAIQEPDLCHRFTARIIKNVKIGPSPFGVVESGGRAADPAMNGTRCGSWMPVVLGPAHTPAVRPDRPSMCAVHLCGATAADRRRRVPSTGGRCLTKRRRAKSRSLTLTGTCRYRDPSPP